MGQLFDNLKEIITLSKETGISLSESINLYKMYQKDSSEDKKPVAKEKQEAEKTEQPSDGKEQPDKVLPNEPPADADDTVIDYKQKVEELEKKISDLQKENVSKDLSDKDTKTNNEIIDDITRSFM